MAIFNCYVSSPEGNMMSKYWKKMAWGYELITSWICIDCSSDSQIFANANATYVKGYQTSDHHINVHIQWDPFQTVPIIFRLGQNPLGVFWSPRIKQYLKTLHEARTAKRCKLGDPGDGETLFGASVRRISQFLGHPHWRNNTEIAGPISPNWEWSMRPCQITMISIYF